MKTPNTKHQTPKKLAITFFNLLFIISLIILVNPQAKAQVFGDSLANIITLDSGIVNVDTSIAIHNSSLSIDGGNALQNGIFNIDVANSAGDLTNGSHPGDVVITAGGSEDGNSNPTTSTNIFDCDQPGIITEAGFHQWNLMPCNPDQCPQQTFDVFKLDKNGVTINTNKNGVNCAWFAKTTINGKLEVNDVATFNSPLQINNGLKINSNTIAIDNLTTTPIKVITSTQNNGNSAQIENFIVYSNGFVKARDLYISALIPFPDYVFAKNYQLLPLPQLEQFITTQNHLPLMPTAEQIQTNGASIGELQRLTIQKVEEITLYLIEQNKQIEELKKQNELLKAQLVLINEKK
jgi:hypothetical protein